MSITLIDIKNALFSHFITETVFNIKEDCAAIGLSDKDLGESLVGLRESLFKAALDDFVRLGITAELSPGVYILTQPVNTFSQPVNLSPMAAEMIADLVNGFGEGTEGSQYVVNKLGITSFDIERLCHFCHFLIDEDTEVTTEEQT